MPISINNTTLTFNNGTTMTTAATGTVSSVATGNGLSGGTITTSGTLSIACPGFNTVGSYCFVTIYTASNGNPVSGSNYSAGTGTNQVWSYLTADFTGADYYQANLSGTWKWMGATNNPQHGTKVTAIACRVS